MNPRNRTPTRIALHHVTRYRYAKPVVLGPQSVRLRPAPHCAARILAYDLSVRPKDHIVHWLQDPNGSWVARFIFTRMTDELLIDVRLTAELAAINPFDFIVDATAAVWPFAYSSDLQVELAAYLPNAPTRPSIAAFLDAASRQPMDTVEVLTELTSRIQREIEYETREEPGVQEPEQTLRRMSGSCRDSAWLLVNAMRHLGIGARFVSGYLIQPPADDSNGQSRSELHAWAEAYLPGAGWIGLDPTLGRLCGERHIPLAASAHYRSAAPVTGSHGETSAELHHEIRVQVLEAVPNGEAIGGAGSPVQAWGKPL